MSSASSASPSDPGGSSVSTRIGPGTPARRSSIPSSTSATPSHPAPDSNAARATGAAPWPYASALTTAISSRGRGRE